MGLNSTIKTKNKSSLIVNTSPHHALKELIIFWIELIHWWVCDILLSIVPNMFLFLFDAFFYEDLMWNEMKQ